MDNSVEDKIGQLKALQEAVEAIEITDADILTLVTPLMHDLQSYGIDQFGVRIPFPTFNDGDPCVAYVSEYMRFHHKDQGVEKYSAINDLFPDHGDEDLEIETYLSAQGLFRPLREILPNDTVTKKPGDMELALKGLYDSLSLLLDLGKIEGGVRYTFKWKDQAVIMYEDGCYV